MKVIAAFLLCCSVVIGADSTPQGVLASVRVGKYGGCSGTIIAIGNEKAYGVSAAHCSSGVDSQFTFGSPDGTTGSARWIAIDRKNDLSLFVCWSRDVRMASPVLRKLPDPRHYPVTACGYPGGAGPKFKSVEWSTRQAIRSTNGQMFDRNTFLIDSGPFAGGDSGGGVFVGGTLCFVMTHGHDHQVIHATQHDQLVKFLDANKSQFKGCKPFADPVQCRPGGN